ncbi:hypothetical protein Tsubulata_023798 [Turnera subulata]|uniref:Uncharacterized protein n=1 Tax=Turnera subulata TaxID=218843 RepID=A0A9Q0G2M0_9ROSI|nr:hypothetical protein Tsubulata_023798 [Turnera subulata]
MSGVVLPNETMNIDDLKQKLFYTTIELESLKMKANEEMSKHREDVKQLLILLKAAYQERDEAKDQLQKLVNKFMLCSPTELSPIVPQPQPESPILVPTKANSSITESNSLSDTYNHHSHGSSPVDSFFDAVTSPEFSSINMADSSHMGGLVNNNAFVQEHKSSMFTGLAPVAAAAKIDMADARIDNYIKGKVLPEKGRLLQTVLEAGPLLQTLLVAGPLPRWRNPPPVQPYKIPPVSITGSDTASITNQKQPFPANFVAQKPPSHPSPLDLSRGSSQMCSASMLNFAGGASCSALDNGWLLNSGAINKIPSGKRQRFH